MGIWVKSKFGLNSLEGKGKDTKEGKSKILE